MTSAEAALSLETASYEEIERAVMHTERGRWFLAEHARRARADDTARVFAAIHRLEAMLAKTPAVASLPQRDAHIAPSIDQLMQRLSDAISDMNQPVPDHAPATMADIDLLSPADRMRLFL